MMPRDASAVLQTHLQLLHEPSAPTCTQ
jgi:hypothetical protein